MGMNIMGFATSINTNDLAEIAKKINIKISDKFGTWTLEEAMSDIQADEICIAKTKNGSIILVGDEFPIMEIKLRPLSENENKVLRFMYGETSMVFLFEYQENGKVLRIKSVYNYETNAEKGKALEVEFSGIEIDEVIMELIQKVSGDDIFTMEPDHKVERYRYLGKIENEEIPLTTKNETQINHQISKKPWWKIW
jgi:hypothetical protein